MLIFLPDEQITFDKFIEAKFDANLIAAAMEKAKDVLVEVELPKMTLDSTLDLTDVSLISFFSIAYILISFYLEHDNVYRR